MGTFATDVDALTLAHALAMYNRNVSLAQRVADVIHSMEEMTISPGNIEATIVENPDTFLAELPMDVAEIYLWLAWNCYRDEAQVRVAKFRAPTPSQSPGQIHQMPRRNPGAGSD